MVFNPAPLRAWRTERRITQTAFAEQLGITPTYLSYIETGAKSPGLELVSKIVELTGIPANRLIGDDLGEEEAPREIDMTRDIILNVKFRISKDGEVRVMNSKEERQAITIEADGRNCHVCLDIFEGATVSEIRRELNKALEMVIRQAEVYARV